MGRLRVYLHLGFFLAGPRAVASAVRPRRRMEQLRRPAAAPSTGEPWRGHDGPDLLSSVRRTRRLRRPRIRRAIRRFFCRHPNLKPRLPFLGRRRWFPGDHERLYPDAPPFLGGVREPRRPKPTPPADAVALKEPQN